MVFKLSALPLPAKAVVRQGLQSVKDANASAAARLEKAAKGLTNLGLRASNAHLSDPANARYFATYGETQWFTLLQTDSWLLNLRARLGSAFAQEVRNVHHKDATFETLTKPLKQELLKKGYLAEFDVYENRYNVYDPDSDAARLVTERFLSAKLSIAPDSLVAGK